MQTRLPGFTMKMGFGLHFGWAVESAIGSPLKIDASYLRCDIPYVYALEYVVCL